MRDPIYIGLLYTIAVIVGVVIAHFAGSLMRFI